MSNGRQANGDHWVAPDLCEQHIFTEGCVCYVCENERLRADCEMKDKRIDWTVADNVKQALRIAELEGALRDIADSELSSGGQLRMAARQALAKEQDDA